MSSTKADTRARILDTTWRLMEKEMGRGVKMSDIAKGAGLSRQAIYLHFGTRAELLIQTARYIDEQLGVEARLEASRRADSGPKRLAAYVAFWGSHMPQIYGTARALLAARDDDDAKAAWDDRMQAHRHGCDAIITMLQRERTLHASWTHQQACEILWTLLSFRNWEMFTVGCGWTADEYVQHMQCMTRQVLVSDAAVGTKSPTNATGNT